MLPKNLFNKVWIVITSFALLISTNAIAQTASNLGQHQKTLKMNRANNLETAQNSYPDDAIVTHFVKNDSILGTFTLDLNEQQDMIVQLEGMPILLARKSGKDVLSARITIENIQKRLLADIQSLENQLSTISLGRYPKHRTTIKRQFQGIFNGIAIQSTRGVVQEIMKLPYVKKVHKDVPVKAVLDESVPLIRADEVWTQLGAKGDGIIVGIIDTGIDYLHPDLGGGLGSGYKVIGGYDFVNDDADPMDDNGHGTHCAGIVAANGTLTGVAPEAKLMAFKVLNQNGFGFESDVIAGIERACDPDQNPTTSDAVNVISMSLGGSGDPDDAGAIAIDNATALGVVCVVAAGNEYNYQSILSPGCARTAVTVGATDKSDVIASFSSRGPSNKIYHIKPDLVAPGVDINSTILNNGYGLESGTSMATPHIAGVAALLTQLHPNWSPAMIKAALMENSIDIGEDVFTQGSGRSDAFESATAEVMILPGSLSFGVDDFSQPVWFQTDTLEIINTSNTTHTFSLSVSGNLPAGIVTSITPRSVTLNANQKQMLIVELRVDNAVVPFPNEEPYAYEGKIVAQSSTETIHVPFAFIKSHKLELIFDQAPYCVFIHNKLDKGWLFPYPGTYLSILLPLGNYDIMTRFASGWVFRENVYVENLTVLNINTSEAIFYVDNRPVDEQGRYITTGSESNTFIHRRSGYGLVTWSLDRILPLNFSPVSSNYRFDWRIDALYNQKYYQFHGLKNGFSTNYTFSNAPADLINYETNIYGDPNFSQVYFKVWSYHFDDVGRKIIGSGHSGSAMGMTVNRPSRFNCYYIPAPDSAYYSLSQFEVTEGASAYFFQAPDFETTYLSFEPDTIRGLYFDFGFPTAFTSTSKKFHIGLAPPFWSGRFYNQANTIRLDHYQSYTNRNYYFSNQMKDYTPRSFDYFLYSHSGLIQQDSLFNGDGGFYNTISILPEAYLLRTPYTFWAKDRQATAVMQAYFNTKKLDKNPPYLLSFNAYSNGELVDLMELAGNNQIAFALKDDGVLKETNLYYHTQSNPVWKKLPLSQVDSLFTAQLPSNLTPQFVSLKLEAADVAGNWLNYKVEPGLFSNPPVIFDVTVQPDFIRPGDPIIITAHVFDDKQVTAVTIEIESPDETIVATLPLYDDGLHNDGSAGDRKYGNSWTTLPSKLDYLIDISASDNESHVEQFNNVAKFTTKEAPYVQIDSIYFYNNLDNFVNPGEAVRLKVKLKNIGIAMASQVSATISSSDPFVASYLTQAVAFGDIQPGQAVATANDYDFYFRVSDSCPDSQTIALRMQITDNQMRAWTDSLKFLVIDNVGPFLRSVELSHRYVPAGQPIHFLVEANDGSGIAEVKTLFKIGDTNTLIDSLVLYDDGNHDDRAANDGWFGNSWTTPTIQQNYKTSFKTRDKLSNIRIYDSYYEANFTTIKLGQNPILLVADNGGSDPSGFLDDYQNALVVNSYGFDVWNCFYRGQPDRTALDASIYATIIWAIPTWGYLSNYSSVRNALKAYLNDGGKLFISGKDLAYYLDFREYDRKLFHDYFHAEFVNDNTGLTGLNGVAGDPITDGLSLKLASGYGADEINPVSPALTIFTYDITSIQSIQAIDSASLSELISDDQLAQQKETVVATGIASSGSGGIRVDTGTYQLVYLSFSFHDINSINHQAVLMRKILEWFGLAAGPKISQVNAEPSYLAPGANVTISARATDDQGVASVIAEIESPDENLLATVNLFDDGLHQDETANDGIYANSWTTLSEKLDYLVDIVAADNNNNIGRLNNAASFTTRDVPYIKIDHVSFYNNPDNIVSPDEYIYLKVYLKNVGNIAATGVSASISSTDPFVGYYSSSPKNFGDILPGRTVATSNNYDFYFRASDASPDSQVIAFEMQITDDQLRLWTNHLEFLVIDNVGPKINSVKLDRRYVPAGQSIHISVDAVDGSGVAEITAYFKDGDTNAMIGDLVLFDDGSHGDGAPGDNRFGNSWDTPTFQRNYKTSFKTRDKLSNFREYTSFIEANFTTIALGQSPLLLIVDDDVSDPASFLKDYQNALLANSYKFDTWNCYYRGIPDSTGLDVSNYSITIWAIPYYGYFAGYSNSKLRQTLKSYLDNGGNLFISGENIAYYLDYLDRDKKLINDYFHAHFVSDNSGCTKINGVANDPISDGFSLTLASGYDTDEIDPISPAETIFNYQTNSGTSSSGSELNDGTAEQKEIIDRHNDPIDTLVLNQKDQMGQTAAGVLGSGSAGIRINSGTFKIVYLSFNFHEILDANIKKQLISRILTWLSPINAISGRINYYSRSDSLPVASVKLLLSGGQADSTLSDDNGFYEFKNLVSGNLIITPQKSGDSKMAVTHYDAALILRFLSHYISLNPYQMIAADVTGDDSITTADALNILKYCVGSTSELPIHADWTFVPHDFPIDTTNWASAPRKRVIAAVDSIVADQNFYAIVHGDVSGNWQPPNKILAKDQSDDLIISNLLIEPSYDPARQKVSLSLGAIQTEQLYSLSIAIQYDPAWLNFVDVRAIHSNQESMLLHQIEQRVIHIVLAASKPINIESSLLTIDFALNEIAAARSSNALQIAEIALNDHSYRNLNINVDLDFSSALPTVYDLAQNYPNPFNSQTIIKYQLPEAAQVKIEIFNLLGQRVRLLLDDEKKAGYYQLNWDGRDDSHQMVSSGVYLCHFTANQFKKIHKMILMK